MARKFRNPNARLQNIARRSPEELFVEIREALVDIWSIVFPFEITVTADYTTTGKAAVEEVECNNTSSITVTLHSPPKARDIVIISKINTGGVTIETAGSETINGSSSITILAQYDTPNLIFREDQNEWRIF